MLSAARDALQELATKAAGKAVTGTASSVVGGDRVPDSESWGQILGSVATTLLQTLRDQGISALTDLVGQYAGSLEGLTERIRNGEGGPLGDMVRSLLGGGAGSGLLDLAQKYLKGEGDLGELAGQFLEGQGGIAGLAQKLLDNTDGGLQGILRQFLGDSADGLGIGAGLGALNNYLAGRSPVWGAISGAWQNLGTGAKVAIVIGLVLLGLLSPVALLLGLIALLVVVIVQATRSEKKESSTASA